MRKITHVVRLSPIRVDESIFEEGLTQGQTLWLLKERLAELYPSVVFNDYESISPAIRMGVTCIGSHGDTKVTWMDGHPSIYVAEKRITREFVIGELALLVGRVLEMQYPWLVHFKPMTPLTTSEIEVFTNDCN